MLPANAHVFSATHLGEKLNLRWRGLDDELIILHRVPGSCLRGTRSLSDIYHEGTCNLDARSRLVTVACCVTGTG
jgi:hypothetical protein